MEVVNCRMLSIAFLLLAATTLVACNTTPERFPVNVATTESPLKRIEESALPFDPLNGRYRGFDDLDGPIRLVQGQWHGEPWVEGSSSRPQVMLLDDISAAGDLDGDGVDDHAYLLNLVMGGTGQLLYLAAVTDAADSNSTIVASLVGDRVKIRQLAIRNGQVWLDVLQAGPDDAMCCPGELATRTWALDDGQMLVEQASNMPARRFDVASLQGSQWQLERWSWDEPAGETGVTLKFGQGEISGHSGCNHYRSSIGDGQSPGEVQVGPTMGTRKACPADQSAVESRFLQSLASAGKLGFLKGRLILNYQVEGVIQTLFFSPMEP